MVTTSPSSTTFMGGKLNFKGDSKNKKKKKKSHKKKKEKIKHSIDNHHHEVDDDLLTEAEKRSQIVKLKREEEDLKKLATKSHRERVEDFNEQLGKLTEHNDIPRVSAAGNG